MGNKLGKMVKIISFILLTFTIGFLDANPKNNSQKFARPDVVAPNELVNIYKVSVGTNDITLISSKISKIKKTELRKFNTVSKKDKYAIKVINERGKQVLILGLGNPFTIHADHIGYEDAYEFTGDIDQTFEITTPINTKAYEIALLIQDEFGFKEVKKIQIY